MASVTYQEGTDGYTGCKEVEIYLGEPDTSQGLDTDFEIAAWSGDYRNLIIKWDLSGIPAGSTIVDVKISLSQYLNYTTTYTGYCRRLLKDWVEQEATYNSYSTGNAWDTAGANASTDRSDTLSASLAFNNTNEWKIWTDAQLVTDVQNFIDGVWDNYGWRFSAEASTFGAKLFRGVRYTTESSRPKITIEYNPAGVSGATASMSAKSTYWGDL